MSTFINTEEMDRASIRMARASEDATRAADRIEDSLRQFTMLLGSGYGNNAELLIELLSKQHSTAQPTDSEMLDHLEREMDREQEALKNGTPFPNSLFRACVPITRNAIRKAMGGQKQ